MFKRWSNEKIQFWTLFLILGGVLLYLIVALLHTSLTCIDDKGCILERCVMETFNEDYVNLIDIASTVSTDCRYILGSTQDQFLRQRTQDTSAFDDTCQPTVNLYIDASLEFDAQNEPSVVAEQVKTTITADLVDLAAKTESIETVKEPSVDAAMRILYQQLDLALFDADGFVDPADVAIPTIENAQVGCDTSTSVDVFKAEVFITNQVNSFNRDVAVKEFSAWSGFDALNSCTEGGIWFNEASICDLCPQIITRKEASNAIEATKLTDLITASLTTLATSGDAFLDPAFNIANPVTITAASTLVNEKAMASTANVEPPTDDASCEGSTDENIAQYTLLLQDLATIQTQLAFMQDPILFVNSCLGLWATVPEICAQQPVVPDVVTPPETDTEEIVPNSGADVTELEIVEPPKE